MLLLHVIFLALVLASHLQLVLLQVLLLLLLLLQVPF